MWQRNQDLKIKNIHFVVINRLLLFESLQKRTYQTSMGINTVSGVKGILRQGKEN